MRTPLPVVCCSASRRSSRTVSYSSPSFRSSSRHAGGAWRVVTVAAAGAAVVFLAFAVAGFSWFEGLRLAHERYYAGVASRRPYDYFLVADVAAFALVVGPAAAVALARLRDRATWILVAAALGALALADVSGMSKAEVERIWLPFAPWVLLACAAFAVPAVGRASTRRTPLVARRTGGNGAAAPGRDPLAMVNDVSVSCDVTHTDRQSGRRESNPRSQREGGSSAGAAWPSRLRLSHDESATRSFMSAYAALNRSAAFVP